MRADSAAERGKRDLGFACIIGVGGVDMKAEAGQHLPWELEQLRIYGLQLEMGSRAIVEEQSNDTDISPSLVLVLHDIQ